MCLCLCVPPYLGTLEKKAKPSYSPLNKKLMRQMTHVVVGQKIIDLILKGKVKVCKS